MKFKMNYNYIKSLFLLGGLFLGAMLGYGQNYVLLPDASGFDRSGYEAVLETATQELIFVLPSEFQEQFKVFDFGFYLHNETQEGGFEEAFEYGKTLAASQAPYYLLFGKQSDENGIYTNFWVDIKLPANSSFPCSEQVEISELIANTQTAVQSKYLSLSNNPLKFDEAEIRGIEYLTRKVNKIFNCCITEEFNQDNVKKSTLCTECDDPSDLEISIRNLGFAQYSPASIVNVQDQDGLITEIEIKDEFGTTPLFAEINEFMSNLDSDYSTHFEIKVFDLSENCDSISTEFIESSYASWGDLSNGPNTEGHDYFEQILIIKQEGEKPLVFYRFDFSTDLYTGSSFCSGFQNSDKKSLIIPALVARWIIKRAIMAGTGVILDIVMSTTAEYAIGDHETFSDAWDNTELQGWALFWAALEGATSNQLAGEALGVAGSCIQFGVNYMKNLDDCTFMLDDFMTQVALGCGAGLIGALLGRLVGKVLQVAARKWGDQIANLLVSDLWQKPGIFMAFLNKEVKTRTWRLLENFDVYRRDLIDLDILNDLTIKFPNRTNNEITDGISTKGFYRYCINGLGCFVKDTPVLIAKPTQNNSPFSISKSGFLALAAVPILAVPIQEVQLLDYAVAHKTVNSTYGLTASTNEAETYIDLLNNDPYTSDQQRERDTYEINDQDWNEVTFEEVNGSSMAKLALHSSWINQKGYQVGAEVIMDLPEQGISGSFKISSIKHILPQKKPIDEDNKDDYSYKPITGLFIHSSSDVWNISFDNGEKLGVTHRHPIFSSTRGTWQLAGELKIGEGVLTKKGSAYVVSKKLERGQKVFNLEVKDFHNFLVNESGIVVHNTGSCFDAVKKVLKGYNITHSTVSTRSSPFFPNVSATRIDNVVEVDYGGGIIKSVPISGRELPDFTGVTARTNGGLPMAKKFEAGDGKTLLKGNPQSNRLKDNKLANDWLIDDSGLLDDVEDFAFPNGGSRESSWVLIKKDGKWQQYTWHHHENGKTMMLVEREAHSSITHTGGAAIASTNNGPNVVDNLPGFSDIFPDPEF